MLTFISTLVLIVIGVGLKYRRRVEIHIPAMALAFVMDIGLLLYIEWTRHAIATVQEELVSPVPSGLLVFHVAVSLLTVLLYLALIGSGIQLFRGQGARRAIHRMLAYVFIVCRVANYVTSFFVVSAA